MLIPNKEARTVAKVLVDQHFNIYGLSDQLHSDNGREFVNNLWKELSFEFKIQHTTTPQYNPSSNPVEVSIEPSSLCSGGGEKVLKIIGICGLMLLCSCIILP